MQGITKIFLLYYIYRDHSIHTENRTVKVKAHRKQYLERLLGYASLVSKMLGENDTQANNRINRLEGDEKHTS